MTNRAAVLVLVALLGVCGFLAWRIWAITDRDLADGIPPIATTTSLPDASDEFLRAWRRDQDATYIAFADVGITGDGVSAFTEDIIVQRNGQRMTNRDGSIIYERDGATETCRQTSGELFCTPEVEIPSTEEREAELRNLVAGDDWRYRVLFAPEPDCYELVLDASRGPLHSDFGTESTVCFDPGTGAMRSKTVSRTNRTESFEASDISDVVEESDLRGVFPVPILERFFR